MAPLFLPTFYSCCRFIRTDERPLRDAVQQCQITIPGVQQLVEPSCDHAPELRTTVASRRSSAVYSRLLVQSG